MPIMNYSTQISVEKSMGEVIGALTRRGVTRISTVFDDDGQAAREFELPVHTEGVLKAMTADKKVPRAQCNPGQAARVAWRIAKDWLAAQSALIDAELASLDEVMLPYMVDQQGNTVYSVMRAQGLKELEAAR